MRAVFVVHNKLCDLRSPSVFGSGVRFEFGALLRHASNENCDNNKIFILSFDSKVGCMSVFRNQIEMAVPYLIEVESTLDVSAIWSDVSGARPRAFALMS